MSICVKDVMIREVITVDANQTAKNAARMMAKYGISGLVVHFKGQIVGILTERDVLTRVVASGQDPEKVTVREIMTEPVIVVNPVMPLEKAINIMFQERIKKLPVVEKNEKSVRLVGIISLTDVARLHPKLLEDIRALVDMTELKTEPNFYIR